MKYGYRILLRSLWDRQQPGQPITVSIKAGLGGVLAISLVAWLSYVSGNPWLMAPFGATCVLLFSVPASPLSQPVNVIGGHLVSTIIGLTLHAFLPVEWWSLGLAVGLSIAVMAMLRVTHPPAGADPLVVMFENPGWEYVIFPVALGSLALVLMAWVFHRLPPRIDYPNLGSK
ncbi:MAG: HPP family protein [Ectothiorhodospiraceae bacterium]|nr:HPP family protein [Ectothiorhodospiraceae bacterium]